MTPPSNRPRATDLSLAALTAPPEPQSPPAFDILPFQAALSLPPKQYLIEGLLGLNDLAMIYGHAKSGKSFVALEIAAAIARGECLFAEHFQVHGPAHVIYATGEGHAGLSNRLHGLKSKWRLTESEMDRVKIVTQVPQLFQEDSARSVYRFIELLESLFPEYLNGGLLILDTWARAILGADENTAKDTTLVLEALKHASDRLGCTILVIHHANKGVQTGGLEIRGSSNIMAGFDQLLKVSRDGSGSRKLSCDISKDSEETPDMTFSVESEVIIDEQGFERRCGSLRWSGPVRAAASISNEVDVELLELLRREANLEELAMTVGTIKGKLKLDRAVSTLSGRLNELVKKGLVEVSNFAPDDPRNKLKNPKTCQHYWVKPAMPDMYQEEDPFAD